MDVQLLPRSVSRSCQLVSCAFTRAMQRCSQVQLCLNCLNALAYLIDIYQSFKKVFFNVSRTTGEAPFPGKQHELIVPEVFQKRFQKRAAARKMPRRKQQNPQSVKCKGSNFHSYSTNRLVPRRCIILNIGHVQHMTKNTKKSGMLGEKTKNRSGYQANCYMNWPCIEQGRSLPFLYAETGIILPLLMSFYIASCLCTPTT